jgi:transposase-like protein
LTRSDYSTEQFAGFLADLKESFWGDLRGQARQTLKTLLDVEAEQQREECLGLRWYQRPPEGAVRTDRRNGFYERDYVTPLGIIRRRVPRTRRRAHDRVKPHAQKIYSAPRLAEARQAFRNFQQNGQSVYPQGVTRLEKDLPDLLNFYALPKHLGKKLRTTNPIERCFVEVPRPTRPRVVFTNVPSVDRIIYAIFHRFNEDWRNHTLELFTQRT